MEKFLYNLGLALGTQPGKQKRLFIISNPDGSPRWFWNAENPSPDFLKFYSVNGLRSLFLDRAIRLIFWCRLQHIVFSRQAIDVTQMPNHPLSQFTIGDYAVFTGTPGPNRKLLLYADHKFIKISLSRDSYRLVENEKAILGQMSTGRNFEVPKFVDIAKGSLVLSDMGPGMRQSGFSDLHALALTELHLRHPRRQLTFGKTDIFMESSAKLTCDGQASSHLLPTYLRQKLDMLAHQLADTKLLMGFAHGDFTPWNCFVQGDRIKLYDFELAANEMPFAFDAFHFVMQQGILVEHLPYKDIKPRLIEAFDKLCTDKKLLPRDSFNTYFKAYLFINTSFYLGVYAQQENWHIQINWLLRTWNDAMSDLLFDHQEPRSLLIGDIFDSLKNKAYAALKFPEIDPRDLGQHTDIDLLMSKDLAMELCAWITSHSLVHRISVESRSNMRSLMIILVDGSMLALDLVWQLKRKHLEFMSVSEVLSSSLINEFGVRVPAIQDLRNYLTHFYGLNGAAIPRGYRVAFENGTGLEIDQGSLFAKLMMARENNGWSGVVNKIAYILDSLKMLLRRQGLILTFSGVDGAGKSTVIEHTKLEMEKRFRRRVVVIRHRPSVLPILSAWTKGKQTAEKHAASTLPRQGSNKSLISSLLRFAYYYTDYLFGQFYIYLRFVRTGHIVLYDRYYFDFINDSLRSNIRLPKWLTKLGYRFLLKPNLNFFLYADAPVILSRKRELDAQAITQLTSEYIKLFSELDRGTRKQYFSVENIHLTETLEFITSKAQAQLI